MLPTLKAPELFFGICAPVGTDNNTVVELIREILYSFGYETEYLKVTRLMQDAQLEEPILLDRPFNKRYETHISYANRVRELSQDDSILALMCCAAVRNIRRQYTEDPNGYLHQRAYIFDQFKRTEEIQVLRQIYGKSFVVVSVHSEKNKRISKVADRIASDLGFSRSNDEHQASAVKLISQDEDEEDVPNGQRLRDAFSLADLFIDIDRITQAEKLLIRFLRGLFGSNAVTPTRSEYGMYMAKSASLRSSDLSRQVGAAIFSSGGEVISLGSNEVPKPHGGTYWCDDPGDARDHVLKRDMNERIKRSILVDVVMRLRSGGYVKSELDDLKLTDFVLSEAARKGSTLRESLVMDLLEFGRIIHAEMSAICDAARLGRSLKGAVLYGTTFPCHLCAKHIVASGISRVEYIEPYPKSYAEQLHSDSIIVSPYDADGSRVQFAPFIGISPFRYSDIFGRGKRKDPGGDFLAWQDGAPRPIVKHTVATYLENEKVAMQSLGGAMNRLSVNKGKGGP
jgi:deoxycytidylate deaminase